MFFNATKAYYITKMLAVRAGFLIILNIRLRLALISLFIAGVPLHH